MWRVLAVEDGKALVLSDAMLDVMPFYTGSWSSPPAKGWMHSPARTWANNTFYQTAFSAAEKRLIRKNDIPLERGKLRDVVFFLSLQEYNSCRGVLGAPAEPTPFSLATANSQGKESHSSVGRSWWLRTTMDDFLYHVYAVNSETGEAIKAVAFQSDVLRTTIDWEYVRPAVWLDIS